MVPVGAWGAVGVSWGGREGGRGWFLGWTPGQHSMGGGGERGVDRGVRRAGIFVIVVGCCPADVALCFVCSLPCGGGRRPTSGSVNRILRPERGGESGRKLKGRGGAGTRRCGNLTLPLHMSLACESYPFPATHAAWSCHGCPPTPAQLRARATPPYAGADVQRRSLGRLAQPRWR